MYLFFDKRKKGNMSGCQIRKIWRILSMGISPMSGYDRAANPLGVRISSEIYNGSKCSFYIQTN